MDKGYTWEFDKCIMKEWGITCPGGRWEKINCHNGNKYWNNDTWIRINNLWGRRFWIPSNFVPDFETIIVFCYQYYVIFCKDHIRDHILLHTIETESFSDIGAFWVINSKYIMRAEIKQGK